MLGKMVLVLESMVNNLGTLALALEKLVDNLGKMVLASEGMVNYLGKLPLSKISISWAVQKSNVFRLTVIDKDSWV